MRWLFVPSLLSIGLLALACDESGTADSDSDPGNRVDIAPEVASDVAPDVAEATRPEVDAVVDSADVVPEASPTTCPSPPFGTGVGDTVADYTLYNCEGAPVSLASVCDRDVTFLNLFAGWCPPCNSHARSAPADYAELAAGEDSLAWLFVITEDSTGAPADLDYCNAVRESYDLPMTVLVDLDGGLPDHLALGSPNSWYLVLSAGLRLEARFKYDKDGALDRARELSGE